MLPPNIRPDDPSFPTRSHPNEKLAFRASNLGHLHIQLKEHHIVRTIALHDQFFKVSRTLSRIIEQCRLGLVREVGLTIQVSRPTTPHPHPPNSLRIIDL